MAAGDVRETKHKIVASPQVPDIESPVCSTGGQDRLVMRRPLNLPQEIYCQCHDTDNWTFGGHMHPTIGGVYGACPTVPVSGELASEERLL